MSAEVKNVISFFISADIWRVLQRFLQISQHPLEPSTAIVKAPCCPRQQSDLGDHVTTFTLPPTFKGKEAEVFQARALRHPQFENQFEKLLYFSNSEYTPLPFWH